MHRNSDWTEEIRYSPDLAEEKNQKQLRQKGRDIKLGKDYELAEYLEENIIKKKYSPYAVIKKMKQDGKKFSISICRATIYNYIKKGIFLNLTASRQKSRQPHQCSALNCQESLLHSPGYSQT